MPVPGGSMNVEIDEFEKPSRVYMFAIPTSSESKQNTNLQQKTTMVSKLDMFRHGLIHFDVFKYNFNRFAMNCVYIPEHFFF